MKDIIIKNEKYQLSIEELTFGMDDGHRLVFAVLQGEVNNLVQYHSVYFNGTAERFLLDMIDGGASDSEGRIVRLGGIVIDFDYASPTSPVLKFAYYGFSPEQIKYAIEKEIIKTLEVKIPMPHDIDPEDWSIESSQVALTNSDRTTVTVYLKSKSND